MCCMCQGICGHSGPHTYCQAHDPSQRRLCPNCGHCPTCGGNSGANNFQIMPFPPAVTFHYTSTSYTE